MLLCFVAADGFHFKFLVYRMCLCVQVWKELFSPLHALNFGIGGDTTCNVLWRLQNGELENIRPRVREKVGARDEQKGLDS